MSQAISVRLPDDLTKALDQVSRTIDRPKAYLIKKAIEAYLVEYADYQIALDRFRDNTDSIVSGQELKRRLGL